MLMWFTQRQVRSVVVLVGECWSCFVVSASTDSVSRTSVLKQGEQQVKVKYRLK